MTAPAAESLHPVSPGVSSLWTDAIFDHPREIRSAVHLIGVLPGEGVGPEVVGAALRVLDAMNAVRPLQIRRITGGPIGLAAKDAPDGRVNRDTAEFCRDIFEQHGALFCGPGGGRFVYDLRERFDLFCKLAPLKPSPSLRRCCCLKSEWLTDVDILVVRDNSGGIYQGKAQTRTDPVRGLVAEQTFSYCQSQVKRIVQTGARLARQRRGHMHVVIKDGGVPAITELWKQVTRQVAPQVGVEFTFLNADYAAYYMIQRPRDLDVLVCPNMVGDILADLGAALLGARGLSFSGNFSAGGRAVYQTGHGAAYDLAGTDRANPVAQILSLAMMLRESFGMVDEAHMIEEAVEHIWSEGYRTEDLAEPGTRPAGMRELTDRIADAAGKLARNSDR